jgi:tetratricopeptide (TPR) repeat protein
MRRCASAVGLAMFVSLVLLPVSSQAEERSRALREATELFRKGTEALKKQDLAKAKDLMIKATNTLPGFPEANLALGHIALQEKAYPDALSYYEKARDGYAQIGDLLFDLQQDRFRDAQIQIREFRDELLNLDNTRVKVGNVDTRKLQMEEAIHKLELIRAPSPTSAKEPPAEVFFYIGNAHFYLKHLEQAVTSWEACAKDSPQFGSVFNNLASGYLLLNQPEKALENLQRA